MNTGRAYFRTLKTNSNQKHVAEDVTLATMALKELVASVNTPIRAHSLRSVLLSLNWRTTLHGKEKTFNKGGCPHTVT